MDPIGLSGPNLFRTQHHRTLATKAYVNCANPDCLGEPRCSSWEICKSGTETNMEEDELFELLSRQLDSEAEFVQASTSPSSDHHSDKVLRQFAPPKSDMEVERARGSGIPTKTKQDTT